jgi:hypothetical protein
MEPQQPSVVDCSIATLELYFRIISAHLLQDIIQLIPTIILLCYFVLASPPNNTSIIQDDEGVFVCFVIVCFVGW